MKTRASSLKASAEVRFWLKIDFDAALWPSRDAWETCPNNECWKWVGAVTSQGYGVFNVEGKQTLAHRFSMMIHGLELGENTDHLCRNRLCVRPSHLEAVTIRENTARGNGKASVALRENVCKNGHALDGDNVATVGSGWRVCRTCQRLASQKTRNNKEEV